MAMWVEMGMMECTSVLARNEEFSKIAVIKFFYSSQKKVICGGGIMRGKFRDIPRKSTV